MFIDCKDCNPSQLYHLMVQTIIPRPIAWVLSDNGNDSYNLAPFSYFNGVASSPPVLMISAGHKSDGSRKDTWVNIDERDNFVVHIPSSHHLQEVIDSAADLKHGESELSQVNIPLMQEDGVKLPRLQSAMVAFYCTKYAIHEVGDAPQGLILGEIKHIWVADPLVDQSNDRITIKAEDVNPLARLGGRDYTVLGEKLALKKGDRD